MRTPLYMKPVEGGESWKSGLAGVLYVESVRRNVYRRLTIYLEARAAIFLSRGVAIVYGKNRSRTRSHRKRPLFLYTS